MMKKPKVRYGVIDTRVSWSHPANVTDSITDAVNQALRLYHRTLNVPCGIGIYDKNGACKSLVWVSRNDTRVSLIDKIRIKKTA